MFSCPICKKDYPDLFDEKHQDCILDTLISNCEKIVESYKYVLKLRKRIKELEKDS